jgi:pSer/pThr/pTyr-binding forkhead associated (FHA) protein
VLELEGNRILIGRSSVTVRLEANDCSRHHAEIYEQNGALRIRDLDSKNGCSVNGLRFQDIELSEAMDVKLGSCRLRIVAFTRSEDSVEVLPGWCALDETLDGRHVGAPLPRIWNR